jgi:hypothetical protein
VHGQTSAIAHDGRGFLAGLPQPFEAARYHSLMVDEGSLPPFLSVTATARGRIPMALRHSTQPTEGVQFHPESILTTCGETIIRNFVQAVRGKGLGASSRTAGRRGRSRGQSEAVRDSGGSPCPRVLTSGRSPRYRMVLVKITVVPDKITVVRQNRVITAGCGQPPDQASRARARNTAHRQDEPGQGASGGLSYSELWGEE